MLRNPRSSTSSTNTTANIPIANNNSNNQYNSAFPRSVSLSHGSNLAHDNDNILGFSNPDNNTSKDLQDSHRRLVPELVGDFQIQVVRKAVYHLVT